MAYNLAAFSFFPGTYSGFSSNLYVDTATNGTVKWQIRVMRDSGSLQPYNLYTDATNGPRFNYTIGPNSATGAAWTYDFRTTSSITIASGSFSTTASTFNYSITTNGKTPMGLAPKYSGSAATNYVAPQPTVPSVNGLTVSQANSAITNAGLSPVNNGAVSTSNSGLDGTVFNQSPSAGTTVSSGSQVSYNYYTYVAPPAPPSAPTGLYTSGTTTGSITLNWNSMSGASGYNLYLNGSYVNATGSTSYTFSGLAANTGYTLGVVAYNSGGSSATSAVTASTLANTFTTPNVIGQSQSVATNTLINAGFGSVTPTLITTGATASNNLLVISQSPVSGTTANTGNTATINVYNYLIAVPNIIGLTETAANTALTNAGFLTRSSSLTTSGATVANNLTVGTQTPTGGSQYNPANNVAYTIYNFLTAVPNVVGLNQDAAITTLTNSGFTTISTTLTDVGVTTQNAGTIKSQTPVNSGTTYNPKNQSVSLVIYSLGITGKRYSATSNSMVSLTTSKRYNGTAWVQTTVAKRFNGTNWVDIVN